MMRWYALGSLLSDVTEWTLGCLLPILSCLSPNKKLQQKPNCRFFVTYCNFGRNFTLCAKIVCVQISRVERRTCQLEGFYGEQYLSDSDTCATTAQPPQKLNLLDLNCKFCSKYCGKKAENIVLQFQVQIFIDDRLYCSSTCPLFPFYIYHPYVIIYYRWPFCCSTYKVFRLCAKTEIAPNVKENTINQRLRIFS